MAIVVDFAWSKPTVAKLQSWGAVAVGMYVSHDDTKNANRNLIQAYAAASIRTFLFFEDASDRAAAGFSAGEADANYAKSFMVALGVPDWAPIIVAVDFDAPDYSPTSNDPVAKLGPIGEYLRAWNAVLGLDRTGIYGDFYICRRAIGAQRARYAIQTIAWSGGQVDTAQIALFQNGAMLDNGQVDVEQIMSNALLNQIAWVPGESNPVATPPTPKPQPPPGPWLDSKDWDWKQVAIVGRGLDDVLYIFQYSHKTGTWTKVSQPQTF